MRVPPLVVARSSLDAAVPHFAMAQMSVATPAAGAVKEAEQRGEVPFPFLVSRRASIAATPISTRSRATRSASLMMSQSDVARTAGRE
jgi:hypothetical protein